MNAPAHPFTGKDDRFPLGVRALFFYAALFALLVAFIQLNVAALKLLELRAGLVPLADPLLALLPAPGLDLSAVLSVLTHGTQLLALIWIVRYPRIFLIGIVSYVVLFSLRLATMWLVPLAHPADMITMYDPVIYQGAPMVNDLFFSGHTASLVLLAMLVRNARLRGFILASLAFVVGAILLQRVHYTVDVVAAPFFTFTTYYWVDRLESVLAPHYVAELARRPRVPTHAGELAGAPA